MTHGKVMGFRKIRKRQYYLQNKEMALIGFHTEKPKHAYEIVNDIKDRYMGDWTVISMSSAHKH